MKLIKWYIHKNWHTIRSKFWIHGSLTTCTNVLKTVRYYHYFCRFELENMSIYEMLPALDLTQYVHGEICIEMHRRVK